MPKSKEEQLESRRRWAAANRERLNKESLDHYHANKDKIRERQKLYYARSEVRARRIEKQFIFYHANKEKINAKRRALMRADKDLAHAEHIKRYGLKRSDYDRMLQEQNGACWICKKTNRSGRRLHVDHCHETGVVRGLLCNTCNFGLGHFKNDIELLDTAVLYLSQAAASSEDAA